MKEKSAVKHNRIRSNISRNPLDPWRWILHGAKVQDGDPVWGQKLKIIKESCLLA